MTLLDQAKEFAEDCDLYNMPIESMAEFAQYILDQSVMPKWTAINSADDIPNESGVYVYRYQHLQLGFMVHYVNKYRPSYRTELANVFAEYYKLPDCDIPTEKVSQSTEVGE